MGFYFTTAVLGTHKSYFYKSQIRRLFRINESQIKLRFLQTWQAFGRTFLMFILWAIAEGHREGAFCRCRHVTNAIHKNGGDRRGKKGPECGSYGQPWMLPSRTPNPFVWRSQVVNSITWFFFLKMKDPFKGVVSFVCPFCHLKSDTPILRNTHAPMGLLETQMDWHFNGRRASHSQAFWARSRAVAR